LELQTAVTEVLEQLSLGKVTLPDLAKCGCTSAQVLPLVELRTRKKVLSATEAYWNVGHKITSGEGAKVALARQKIVADVLSTTVAHVGRNYVVTSAIGSPDDNDLFVIIWRSYLKLLCIPGEASLEVFRRRIVTEHPHDASCQLNYVEILFFVIVLDMINVTPRGVSSQENTLVSLATSQLNRKTLATGALALAAARGLAGTVGVGKLADVTAAAGALYLGKSLVDHISKSATKHPSYRPKKIVKDALDQVYVTHVLNTTKIVDDVLLQLTKRAAIENQDLLKKNKEVAINQEKSYLKTIVASPPPSLVDLTKARLSGWIDLRDKATSGVHEIIIQAELTPPRFFPLCTPGAENVTKECYPTC